MSYQSRQLMRPQQDRVLAGVCIGLARYFGIDPTIVRVGWVIFTLLGGSGFFAYLLGWAIMPDQSGKRAALPVLIVAIVIAFSFFCYLLSLIFS